MIDKDHPDYPAYLAEFEQMKRECQKELASIPPESSHGLDGLSGAVYKKCEKKMKELQQKYWYLYHN